MQAEITVTGFTVNERDDTVQMFEIKRGNDNRTCHNIYWQTSLGISADKATAGADYTAVDSAKCIAAGEVIDVMVDVQQDILVEETEDLLLTVQSSVFIVQVDQVAGHAGVVIVDSPAQGFIEDDDKNITVTIDVPNGNPGDLKVRLTCNVGDVHGDSSPGSTNTDDADTGGNATFLVSDIPDSPALDCVGSMDASAIPAGYEIFTPVNCGDLVADETCTIQVILNRSDYFVDKVYTDGAQGAVTMSLVCNPDTIGPQGAEFETNSPIQVSPGATGQLWVQGYNTGNDGNTECHVEESDLALNYYNVSISSACWGTDPLPPQGTFEGCEFVNAPTRATFEVNKIFSDDAETAVEVSIDCNTGLIPDHTKIITPDMSPWEIKWVIIEFNSGELDCTVTETPVSGYLPHYFASIENEGDLLVFGSASNEPAGSGCHFTDIVGGEEARCEIFNELLDVDVEVIKQWFDEFPEFNNSLRARVFWECSNVRYVTDYYDDGIPIHGNTWTDGDYWRFKHDDY